MDDTPEQDGLFATCEPEFLRLINPFVLGYIINNEYLSESKYSIDSRILQRNTLICGAAGMGKSNACMYLLSSLWRNYDIPFLVLEAHTTRYRLPALLADCFRHTVKVFTPGNKAASPLRINALEVPPGVDVQSHIDGLMLLFQSSIKMNLSETNFLRQAFDLMYQQGSKPTLDDLDRCTSNQSFGFAGAQLERIRHRVRSIMSQLRQGAKADLFCSRNSISLRSLFSKPAIIELREALSDAEKNFCSNVILFLLYQFCRTRPITETLQHLVVLEDTERLVNNAAPYLNVNQKSEATSASSLAATLIAQLRFLGEGFVCATNNPAAVPSGIVDNSNLRIIFRILGDADFRTISGGTYLNENHRRVISSLGRGRAVVYKDRDATPYHLAIVFDKTLELPPPETCAESDQVVKEAMATLLGKQ